MRAANPILLRRSRARRATRLLLALWLSSFLPGAATRAHGAVAAADSVTAAARPAFSLGLGPLFATATSPLRAFDAASGAGLALTIETYLGRRFAWDLRLGGFSCDLRAPDSIYYPPDDGDWSIASTALRLDLGRTGQVTWWAGPELSLHYAQMEHFDYVGSGLGLGPAVVMDAPVTNTRFMARVGIHLAWVWIATDFDDASGPTVVGNVGLEVLYRLGPD